MKLLYTADWHLGQTLFEYDRKMEHTQILTWLREQIKLNEVDICNYSAPFSICMINYNQKI